VNPNTASSSLQLPMKTFTRASATLLPAKSLSFFILSRRRAGLPPAFNFQYLFFISLP
jgi:hypothetical protein